MEMQAVIMGCLMMMLLVQNRVDCKKIGFADCIGPKYSVCAVKNARLYCAGKAVSYCAGPRSRRVRLLETATLKLHYCELGCALSRCTQLDSEAKQQVGKCFEACSENTCKSTKIADKQTNDEFCKLACAKSNCGETADQYTVCGSCAKTCS